MTVIFPYLNKWNGKANLFMITDGVNEDLVDILKTYCQNKRQSFLPAPSRLLAAPSEKKS